MPAGYSSQCKVCNSPNRLQIESWSKKDGLSSRAISSKLKAIGEEISHTAINSHMAEHYDVQAEARERYYQSQREIEKAAGERLTDLQILDELIQDSHIIHQGLRKKIKAMGENSILSVPLPVVQLFNGSAAEICRAIKTKQEILGEDPGSKGAETFLDLMKLAAEPSEGNNES